jgi:hypothetical protein
MKYMFLVLALLFGNQAFAQVDPAKILLGTWDGHADINVGQERTLVISNLKSTGDNAWTGRGRFGATGQVDTEKPGGNMDISVSSKGGDIIVEFVGANGKAPVSVKLVGENKLEGTIDLIERGKVAKKRITFEKK